MSVYRNCYPLSLFNIQESVNLNFLVSSLSKHFSSSTALQISNILNSKNRSLKKFNRDIVSRKSHSSVTTKRYFNDLRFRKISNNSSWISGVRKNGLVIENASLMKSPQNNFKTQSIISNLCASGKPSEKKTVKNEPTVSISCLSEDISQSLTSVSVSKEEPKSPRKKRTSKKRSEDDVVVEEKVSKKRQKKAVSVESSSLEESCEKAETIDKPKNSEVQIKTQYTVTLNLPKTKSDKNLNKKKVVNDLITNNQGYVVVFTDGACLRNGKNGAKAGIGVWFNHDHPLNISEPAHGCPTNNKAEIQAATRAIEQAFKAGITKLNINTDSKFLINCITRWIFKWKQNSWKLTSGGPVKNKDELIKLENSARLLTKVSWNYVKSHVQIMGNDGADQLARDGARLYKSGIPVDNISSNEG